jgi:MFS family permease
MIVAVSTLAVALASSGLSGATRSIAADFEETRTTVLALVTSIFVLGFAIGPLVWAPLSEIYGRRMTLLVSYFFFTLWNAVAISSPNIAALIVFRFLAGAFGSSPLTYVYVLIVLFWA